MPNVYYNRGPGAGCAEFSAAVASLPEDQRADWWERAAIMQYDAGATREIAERRALELLRRHIAAQVVIDF